MTQPTMQRKCNHPKSTWEKPSNPCIRVACRICNPQVFSAPSTPSGSAESDEPTWWSEMCECGCVKQWHSLSSDKWFPASSGCLSGSGCGCKGFRPARIESAPVPPSHPSSTDLPVITKDMVREFLPYAPGEHFEDAIQTRFVTFATESQFRAVSKAVLLAYRKLLVSQSHSSPVEQAPDAHTITTATLDHIISTWERYAPFYPGTIDPREHYEMAVALKNAWHTIGETHGTR